MNSNVKRNHIFAFFIAISVVFVGPIDAYVLQGPHVLDLMIENLGKAKSLFVSHKIFFYRSGIIDDSERLFPGG